MNRRPPVFISPINHNLSDGTEILVRSVNSFDKPLFIRGLVDLSPRSTYYRFNTSAFKCNPVVLKYFTEVNQVDHVAIGAGLTSGNGVIRRGVGVGRFIRMQNKPEEAELALTVADAYQRSGVGTILLAALSRCALEQGVRFFVLHIHGGRRKLIQCLLDLDACVVQRRSNVVEILLPVPTPELLQVGQRKSLTVYRDAYNKFDSAVSA